MKITLWVIQILLALLFLFAGGAKLAMSAADLTKGAPFLSAGFLRFIGVCEILGALGLILPTLLRIRPGLTPLAAACLVIIMIGAVAVTIPMGLTMAIMPFLTGLLAAFVAYGRWRLVPVAPK